MEQILESYAKEIESRKLVELVASNPTIREGVEIYTLAMIWYFARAVGLTVEQVNAGLDELSSGRQE